MILPRYTVIYSSGIESDLADLWVRFDSAQRRRLTVLMHVVDQELATIPERKGELADWDPAVRVWTLPDFDPPIRVTFKVLPDDRKVLLLNVILYVDGAD